MTGRWQHRSGPPGLGSTATNWFQLNKGRPARTQQRFSFYLGAMTTFGNYLYVGGKLHQPPTNSGAKYSARWGRHKNWYSVPGVSAYVFAYKVVGTNLYAGGVFPTNQQHL